MATINAALDVVAGGASVLSLGALIVAKFSHLGVKTMKSAYTVAVVSMLALPTAGSAATISMTEVSGGQYSASLVATGSAAWSAVDQTKSTQLPNGSSWSVTAETLPSAKYGIAPGEVSDPCLYACSPFYGGVYGTPSAIGAPGWETTSFFTVFAPLVGESTWMHEAVLNFTKVQNSLSLLWGSPDQSNLLELLLGGKVVASFWGADFDWFGSGIVNTPGSGAALLKLSGLNFDGLRFAAWTNEGSFEFSNVTTSPVPLPPAMLILSGGLAALMAVSRKSRRKDA